MLSVSLQLTMQRFDVLSKPPDAQIVSWIDNEKNELQFNLQQLVERVAIPFTEIELAETEN